MYNLFNTIKKIAKAVMPYAIVELKRRSKTPKEVLRWYADKGSKTRRFDYQELNDNSLVFDCGGYEGEFASNIFSRYCCKVYVFEPVKKYAQNIQDRFNKNPKIKVYPFGLGAKKDTFSISVDENSSSIFKEGSEKSIAEIISFNDFIIENNIDYIHLIKINIEGGEYDLLSHIIETGLISRIENLQIQFHDFVPNAKNLRENIQRELKKTHHLTYNYDFVWENWKKSPTKR